MADVLERSDPRTPGEDLSEEDRRRAERRKAPGPRVVHEAIRIEGEEELQRPSNALAWSAIAAGLSMGFSLVAEGLLHAGLPDAPWRPLVAKLGYSVGFMVVVLGRQQLFTENTLTVVLPLLEQPSMRRLGAVARVWAVVLAGNVLGAIAFAWLTNRSAIFDPQARATFAELGWAAIAPGFAGVLLRGIIGGWLIALMVWLLPASESARVFVILIITYVVGLGSFSHSIAGSVEVLHLVTAGQLSLGRYLGGFLLPAVIGNGIGGVSLVAALNHAQARPSLPARG